MNTLLFCDLRFSREKRLLGISLGLRKKNKERDDCTHLLAHQRRCQKVNLKVSGERSVMTCSFLCLLCFFSTLLDYSVRAAQGKNIRHKEKIQCCNK